MTLINNEHPIRVTEGLLEKLKFRDVNNGYRAQGEDLIYKKGKLEIRTYDSDDYWHLSNNFKIKFKHLHELQKIYLEIMGKELKLNFAV